MNKSIYFAIAGGLALVAAGVAGARSGGSPTAQAPQPAAREFVIRDVRVFDGERTSATTTCTCATASIVSVGDAVPAGVEAIDGEGRTLLPGLIDAHTHAFGDALERALVFGVTTELDMFTDHRFAAAMRSEQQQAGGALRRADLFSAGTLVTAPKGHGTEYGMPIPTLAVRRRRAGLRRCADRRRLRLHQDRLRRRRGVRHADRRPSIVRSLGATIAAAKTRNKLAVVHIGSLDGR